MLEYNKDTWSNIYLRKKKDGFSEFVCDLLKLIPRGIKHDSIFNKFRRKIYRLLGMKIGKFSYIYNGVTLICPFNIEIGKHSFVNFGGLLSGYGKIKIGNRVSIGYKVTIITETHNLHSKNFDIILKPVIIEDNVWIGSNVTILPGVKIKEGSVIASGAIVIKDTEPYSINGGVPAKKISERIINE